MTSPPTAHSLAEYPDWNGKETEEKGSSAKDVKDLARAITLDPGICKVTQSVKHKVLKLVRPDEKKQTPDETREPKEEKYLEQHVHHE